MNYAKVLAAGLCCVACLGRSQPSQVTRDPEKPVGTLARLNDIDLSAPAASSAAPAAISPSRPGLMMGMHGQAPVVGPTIIVTNPQFFSLTPPFNLLGRSETTIAASDNDIVEGYNDAIGFIDTTQSLSGFAFSADGGKTFTDGGTLPFGMFQGQPAVPLGDPWLDIDGQDDGTFYYSSLALRPNFSDEVGITVHRGSFRHGVLSWGKPAIINPPDLVNDFLDKESLGSDKSGDSRAVYVSTTNFIATSDTTTVTRIELYRSFDGARSFHGPVVVKDPDNLGQQGSQVVVGPNGEVYLTWERGRLAPKQDILFRASKDHGSTFGPLRTVASITGVALFPPVGYNRPSSNDFPRIAVAQSGRYAGRIYVAYQDAGNNANVHNDGVFVIPQPSPNPPVIIGTGGVRDGDVYIKFSDDRGATWSAPVLVSSAMPGDGKAQFWPVVSVEPNGSVDVVYHQDTEVQPQPVNPLATNVSVGGGIRRQSSYQSFVDVFWAHSTDGGQTFSTPLQVNAASTNWGIAASNIQPNFGDYIFSTSVQNKTLVSWAQGVQYDIDPSAAVNLRFVPSAAFATVTIPAGDNGHAYLAAANASASSFSLGQNYPNPFNPTTQIQFSLPRDGFASLKVYNTLGQEVATLVSDNLPAGVHAVEWNASRVASGVYIARLVSGGLVETKKLTLLK